MLATCKCGTKMDIRLRTIIYSKIVEINNVPVYDCSTCFHVEVLPYVKKELSNLIQDIGGRPESGKLNFDELNEWALLISRAIDRDQLQMSIQDIICERIDQLLDLLLLARSLGDVRWEDDLRHRLSQITRTIFSL